MLTFVAVLGAYSAIDLISSIVPRISVFAVSNSFFNVLIDSLLDKVWNMNSSLSLDYCVRDVCRSGLVLAILGLRLLGSASD